MNFIRSALVAIALCGTGLACAAESAQFDAQAKKQYEAEKARCMSGTTGQTQASCLKSAGAAYDSAISGKLANPNTNYEQNAMARCAPLPPGDKADCEARVALGVPRSDVKGGGSIQETQTVVTPTSAESLTTVR